MRIDALSLSLPFDLLLLCSDCYYYYEIIKSDDSVHIHQHTNTRTHARIHMQHGLRWIMVNLDVRLVCWCVFGCPMTITHWIFWSAWILWIFWDTICWIILKHTAYKKMTREKWMCPKFLTLTEYLLPLTSTRVRRAPSGFVCWPIETSSKRFPNNAGQHFGCGFVKQTEFPWHPDRWQSYCNPFRRVQLQLANKRPPRSSRLRLINIFEDIFLSKNIEFTQRIS